MPLREWIEHWVYEVVKVAHLPVPNEIDGPHCMIGPTVRMRRRIRRCAPWLAPRQDSRDCCWHHHVDWRQAADVAVRLVRAAQAAGLHSEHIDDFVMNRVRDERLRDREETAIALLVCAGVGIQLNDDPDAPWHYIDGQHRVAAQLDQGVKETIVQRFQLLDPVTGKPLQD